MLWFLMLFFLFSTTHSLNYLGNNQTSFSWVDIPKDSIMLSNSYPYKGIGCSVYDNANNIYFVSSTNPIKYTYNQQHCSKTDKVVEILHYNFSQNNFTNKLLIGEDSETYPGATGGLGSDNVFQCGIHKKYNILYYLASNIHNCQSNHNYDSSIVRINLTDFTFIDRTILKNIQNVPTFSKYDWSNYKYINIPTTSQLIDDDLWLAFGTAYTGIWKLNMNSTHVTLQDHFQKNYIQYDEEMKSMGGETYYYDTNIKEIKYSFIDRHSTQLYFIEDTLYSDSKIMIVNYSKPLNGNNSRIITLDGINYISDVKFDSFSQKIYVVTGSLSSEIYQYDLNFNKLKISEGCNVDFLKFPTEWGVITNINLDPQTGFLYAPISSRYGNNGLVSINQKDMHINTDSQLIFKDIIENNGHTYYQWHNNMNITEIILDKGVLVVSSNHFSYRKKIAFVNLNGCALGRGIYNTKCSPCPVGKFSNKIGGVCQECHPGYATNTIESINCVKCFPGKFTNGDTTINCINCPNGYFTSHEGSSLCESCKNGTYSITLGSNSQENCIECASGKISKSGSQLCTFCPSGKWSREKKTCIDCPKGTYSFTIGLTSEKECSSCPIGKYSDIAGLIYENQCKECYSGHIGIVEGITSNTSCVSCEQGKYRKNLYTCEECQDGAVSTSSQEQCKICPEGKVSNQYKVNCLDCPLGKFGNRPQQHTIETCIDCDPGKYSNISGITNSVDCHICRSGKYNLEFGSTSIASCLSCISGKFRTIDMDINCEKCPTGQYSDIGSHMCFLCEKGKYSILIDDLPVFCEYCPAGKFIDNKGGYLLESCIDCPSGKYSNKEGLIDYNQCVNCDKGKYSDKLGSLDKSSCINCNAGQYNNNIGSSNINECKPCSTGSISTEGSFKCDVCPPGKYSELMGATECKLCDEGKISREKSSLACNDCPDNSEENIEKTRCSCIKGTYNNNIDGEDCLVCPDKFTCEKGSFIKNISINSNYWRENEDTLNTYKCKNRFACKGGTIVNSTDDLCHEGHKGPICDVCKKGWSKDDGVCLKCPENITRTLSLTILIPVVCIFIIIFLIKTANPSNNKKEEVNGVVKIFMNYAQVFSLASSFQINWPTLIKYLFERAKEFSSPRVSFYSSDCVFQWDFYDKFVVYLALPLVYIIISTIIIFIVSLCYCKKKKKKLRRLSTPEKALYIEKSPTCLNFFIAWEKTAVVVGTFLSWPTIVEKTLEIMNCQKIGDNYYLVKDVSVICYDNKHLNYLIVGYLGLILYGVGIPLMGFRLLYNYRFRLFDMQNRYDGSTPLSFLFLGYREKRWYYEFIIMGKKAGLILLSVFLRNHPRYQIIGASLLIQISFFLHVFLRPYDTITSYGMICNKLESISLLSLVMTLSTGLFFGTVDSGYNLGLFEDILIVMLLLCNGLLCLYFLVYFVVLTFKSVKNHVKEFVNEKITDDKVPFVFRCCSKKNIERIQDWGNLEMADDYGIHLKNQVEKEIFTNYFKEKQSKLSILNQKIDSIKHKRVSVKLDKLRSQIQVMEKERCWQTIQNNRLYTQLKKTVMINKSSMDEENLKQLNDVFNLYVQHGIKYNEKINGLYMEELRDMIDHKMSGSSAIDFGEMQNIIISSYGDDYTVEVDEESPSVIII